MEYTSLYRKYRPKTFDEVIGQDAIVRTLRNMVTLSNVSRAYLFTGPRGNGKTSLARIFARAVNCTEPVNGSPCLKCAACKATEGYTLDIVEMDAASNNSVDDIRALKDSVQYPPADPVIRYKVYIIDEVHQLSPQAFNAFLKTLEEPPKYCIFILATTEVHKLPQTILSRCVRFDFRLLSQSDLSRHVAHIFDMEKVQYTEDAVLTIARAGNGSVRDTLSIADTCMLACAGKVVDYDSVLQVLGANNPLFVLDTLEAIFHQDLGRALVAVESTVTGGKNITVLARDLAQFVRDLLIIKSNDRANDYLCLPADLFNKAKALADSVDKALIMRAMGVFSGLDSGMRYASHPRFILEKAVADCCLIGGTSELDYAARLAGLEQQIDDIKSRPAVQIVKQEVAKIEEPTKEQAQPQPEKNDDGLTAIDNPFEEEIIVTTPTEETKKGGNATLYKGEMITALREKRLYMLFSIFSDLGTRVFIKDKEVTIVLAKKNDCEYCENDNAKLVEMSAKILGFEPTIKYVYNPPKQTIAKDESNLAELVGQSKITKK